MRTRASRDTSPRPKLPFYNMQHEQSTSARGVDALPNACEQRTTKHIQTAVSALELRISEHTHASNTALLTPLQRLTCSTVPTNQQHSIPPDATIANEGGKAAQEPPIDMLSDDSELLELEFVDFSAYRKVILAGIERPPRNIDKPASRRRGTTRRVSLTT
jgi:hypothetical protein